MSSTVPEIVTAPSSRAGGIHALRAGAPASAPDLRSAVRLPPPGAEAGSRSPVRSAPGRHASVCHATRTSTARAARTRRDRFIAAC
jgi:hypothetical protein